MRVLDVGCGPGTYVRAMREVGIDAYGIDPSDALEPTPFVWRTSLDHYVYAERRSDMWPGFLGRFDVVLCLEVAEHVRPELGWDFITHLTSIGAPMIIFSAAQPGQGGFGHVNCQKPEYWRDIFEAHGYELDLVRSTELFDFVRRGGPHMGWFLNNCMVFEKSPDAARFALIEKEERSQAESIAKYLARYREARRLG